MPDENLSEVKVKISTEADTSGATQEVAALNQVKTAATDVGTASKTMGNEAAAGANEGKQATDGLRSGLGDLRTGTRSSMMLMRAMSDFMRGDVTGALKGATIAARGMNMALAANPAGLVIAGLATAVALWSKFGSSAKEAGDDAGAAVKGTGDATKEALEKADNSIKGYIEWLNKAAAAVKALQQANQELADEELAGKMEDVDRQEEDLEISPFDAKRKKIALKAEAEKAKIAAEEEAEGKELGQAENVQQSFQQRAQAHQRLADDQAHKHGLADDFAKKYGYRDEFLDNQSKEALDKLNEDKQPTPEETKELQDKIDILRTKLQALEQKSKNVDAKAGNETRKVDDEEQKDAAKEAEEKAKREEEREKKEAEEKKHAQHGFDEIQRKKDEEAAKAKREAEREAKAGRPEAQERDDARALAGDVSQGHASSPEMTNRVHAAGAKVREMADGGSPAKLHESIDTLVKMIDQMHGKHATKVDKEYADKLAADVKVLKAKMQSVEAAQEAQASYTGSGQ
jgi:hypothetical protein